MYIGTTGTKPFALRIKERRKSCQVDHTPRSDLDVLNQYGMAPGNFFFSAKSVSPPALQDVRRPVSSASSDSTRISIPEDPAPVSHQ